MPESTDSGVLIDWQKSGLQLGDESMDTNHGEMVELVNRLASAKGEAFLPLYQQLIAHTEAHFADEERLMAPSGYGHRSEHEGEHRKLLAEMRHFAKRVEKGSNTLARAFIRDRLPEWLQQHVSRLDATLARHLSESGFSRR